MEKPQIVGKTICLSFGSSGVSLPVRSIILENSECLGPGAATKGICGPSTITLLPLLPSPTPWESSGGDFSREPGTPVTREPDEERSRRGTSDGRSIVKKRDGETKNGVS
ncbi:hypothetical protein GWI33_021681 [Rhynchophorus ferrugineus]|uniref:Uncharacterized protein n=1 Tax=Rhynchophorus ferrugineus TaxID=354439 RepID=A0A834LYI4_RHYFE|nr:hypothetical protein GWI33_021683 [Rhynchophorus ferrugineus]KAF7265031.1 hypothetical protein GWI33_021681 [Rhynchophorus ferrugineus]